MSKNRETDLINLNIIRKNEKIFPEETLILRATTNFMRRITKVADKVIPYFDEQQSLRAIMELFCRNRELTHFSIVCMVNAGYSETKILSRVAIENVLLMRLFAIRPDIANIWFSDPDNFRKEWQPKDIRKAVFAKCSEREKNYEKFYWLLCDYTHPSFKGWFEIFKRQESTVVIGASPEFNPDYSSECIGLICFVAIQSIKVYLDFYKKWLDESTIKEANNLMPKLFEILSRHFEVRSYDKKELLGKNF